MTESRLKSLAGLLYGATLACEIVLPIVVGVVAVAIGLGALQVPFASDTEPTGLFRWIGLAVGLLPAIALLLALDLLRRLFARYRDGDVLTEGSAVLIRQAGKALLAVAALKIAVQPVQSVLLTWQSTPGSRQVSIGIGQAEIGFLLTAGLLTVIGWAMTEAAQIAEENRAFV